MYNFIAILSIKCVIQRQPIPAKNTPLYDVIGFTNVRQSKNCFTWKTTTWAVVQVKQPNFHTRKMRTIITVQRFSFFSF